MGAGPFIPNDRQRRALNRHALALLACMEPGDRARRSTRRARRHRAVEQVERCKTLGVPDGAIIANVIEVHDHVYGRSG